MNDWTKSKIHMGLIFLVGILFDQLSKYYARTQNVQIDGNLISLYFYKNQGLALGSLSSAGANNIALFSGLLYCVISSCLIIAIFGVLKNNRYTKIRWALLFFLMGISGNAFDKIALGYVTDFLIIQLPLFNKLVINFADIYLLSGTLFIMILTLFFTANIWYEGNRRKQLIVEKDFQYDYALKNIFIVSIPIFFSNLITMALIQFFNINVSAQFILWSITVQFIFLIFLALTIFIYGLIESNKISGPIFAFKRAIQNREKTIKFREGDYHQKTLKECITRYNVTFSPDNDADTPPDIPLPDDTE